MREDQSFFENVPSASGSRFANEDVAMFAEVNAFETKPLGAYGYLFVDHGCVVIAVDEKKYTMDEHDLLIILPSQHVCISSMDPNAKTRLMLIQERIFGQVIFINRTYYQNQLYNQPIVHLDKENKQRIYHYYEQIFNGLKEDERFYDKRLVQLAVFAFLVELSNIIKRQGGNIIDASENDVVFKEFVKLVPEHMKAHRDVEFYAKLLNVTPQNLTLIVKSIVGQTAKDFINERLYHESRMLLHRSELNIQEIADNLGFSDQSAFGKFFKKREGFTPAEFRKKHLI